MSSLAPGFLLAAPPLDDQHFSRSVVLLATHDESGAFGWVVNGQPLISAGELLEALSLNNRLDPATAEVDVLAGGPVSREQVWLVYPESSRLETEAEQICVAPGVLACASKEILERIADGLIIPDLRLIAGYSGWAPGQLEQEINEGSWLPCQIEPTTVFDTSGEAMWSRAFNDVGISPFAFNPKSRFEA